MGCYDILNEEVGVIISINNELELTNAMINVFENYNAYDPKKLEIMHLISFLIKY